MMIQPRVSSPVRYPSPKVDIPEELASAPSEPAPALPRPVLLVHGYNSGPGTWDPAVKWLCANPANKDGGSVGPLDGNPIDPQAKVFEMHFSRGFNSPETNVPEMKAAIEKICQATGSPEVDMVTHSMGGLDARLYLNDPGERVHSLAMLAPPNKGSQLANLELIMREKLNFPILPSTDDPEVRHALADLSADTTSHGHANNPFLSQLNANWDTQKARAKTIIMTGNDIPTLTSSPGITLRGDGAVANNSADEVGIESKRARFTVHTSVHTNGGLLLNTAKFLTGQKVQSDPEPAPVAAPVKSSAPHPLDPGNDPIHTTQQAVMLPILDPAFQLSLAMGVLSNTIGQGPNGNPSTDIHVASTQDGTRVDANYHMENTVKGAFVSGTGKVGDQPLIEQANWKDNQLVWDGTVGGSHQQLAMKVNEDNQSLTLTGTVGVVGTELNITPIVDSNGIWRGSRAVGTVNGDPFNVDTLIKVPGGDLLSPDVKDGVLQVRGHLNGESVQKDYEVIATPTPEGFMISASGAGINAGANQSVDLQIRVKDPNKPH